MGASSPKIEYNPPITIILNQTVKVVHSNEQKDNMDMDPSPAAGQNVEAKAVINGKKRHVDLKNVKDIQIENDVNNSEIKNEKNKSLKEEIIDNSVKKSNNQDLNEFSIFNNNNSNNNIKSDFDKQKNNGSKNDKVNRNINDDSGHQLNRPPTDFGGEDKDEGNNHATKGGDVAPNIEGKNKIDDEEKKKYIISTDTYQTDTNNKNINEGSGFYKYYNNNPSDSQLSISNSRINKDEDDDNIKDKLAQSYSGINKGFFLLFLQIGNHKAEHFRVRGATTLKMILKSYLKNKSEEPGKINDIKLYHEDKPLDLNKSIENLNLGNLSLITDKMNNSVNNEKII